MWSKRDAAQSTTPRGLRYALAQRLNWGAVLEKLKTGQDYFVAWVQSTKNGVGVADGFAESDSYLMSDVSIALRRCDDMGWLQHLPLGR